MLQRNGVVRLPLFMPTGSTQVAVTRGPGLSHSGPMRKSPVLLVPVMTWFVLESFRKLLSVWNDDGFLAKPILEVSRLLHPLSPRNPCCITMVTPKAIKSRKLTLLSRAHTAQSCTVLSRQVCADATHRGYRSVSPPTTHSSPCQLVGHLTLSPRSPSP